MKSLMRLPFSEGSGGILRMGKLSAGFRAEQKWGPRALGNRSILVDPRRKEMKDILNQRIKRREGFRPFAPSIMEEYTSEWFDGSYPVPFMEKVYKINQRREILYRQ